MGDEYKVLQELQSDAGIVNGHLDSQTDFGFDFIAVDNFRFLYVRQRFAGTAGAVMDFVYTVSSNGVLSDIPFEEVRTSKLLKPGEELRGGVAHFQDGHFELGMAIYRNDPECCPSGGTLNVLYRLEGGFDQLGTNAFRPKFKFVVAKEWRSKAAGGILDKSTSPQ